MKELVTYIKKGETTPTSIMEQIKVFLKQSNKENFEVTISEVKDIRSAAQNRFFHSVILNAFKEAAIGTNWEQRNTIAWKEELKRMFLGTFTDDVKYVRHTSELTVEEFSVFIENCINFLVTSELQGCIMETDRKVYMHSMGIK